MKNLLLWLSVILLSGFIFSCGKKKVECDPSSIINVGQFDIVSREYSNEDMRMYWQLPTGSEWLLKIGDIQSDIILEDLINTNKEYRGLNRFSFERITANGKGNINLSVNFKYSEYQDAKSEIKELADLLRKRNKELADQIKGKAEFPDVSIKDDKIKVGGEKLDQMTITTPTNDGGKMTRGMILKNYGCYNLFISYEYFSEAGKQELEKQLKKINFKYSGQ